MVVEHQLTKYIAEQKFTSKLETVTLSREKVQFINSFTMVVCKKMLWSFIY